MCTHGTQEEVRWTGGDSIMVSSMDETWTETTDVYEENSMGTTRTARDVNLTFNVHPAW